MILKKAIMKTKEKEKKPVIGIVGMGYAGLPVACLFASKYKVIGYDMNVTRINQLSEGYDKGGDFDKEFLLKLLKKNLHPTFRQEDLKQCNFYVVVVPTPVDENNQPDLTFVISASQTIGQVISKGDIVVYESTVYPGVTEDVCVPEIARVSGLRFGKDFFVGFSPERIDPSNKEHTIFNTVKITSGSDDRTAHYIDSVYGSVLSAGTCLASSIKAAEAAKILENTQRDVNIALMNECSKIFSAMGIDTNKVIDAAATKWNFNAYRPGLVGGHCIGVDPYYLITKANMLGVDSELISAARHVNDSLPEHIVNRLVQTMAKERIKVRNASVLVLGFTFKENCPDIRNTRVFDIYSQLNLYVNNVDVVDPVADPTQTYQEYGVTLTPMTTALKNQYDAVILCVRHDIFNGIDISAMIKDKKQSVVYDIKSFLSDDVATLRM